MYFAYLIANLISSFGNLYFPVLALWQLHKFTVVGDNKSMVHRNSDRNSFQIHSKRLEVTKIEGVINHLNLLHLFASVTLSLKKNI